MELDEHGFLEELIGLRRETWESFPIDMNELFTNGGSFGCDPENQSLVSPYSFLEGLATSSEKAFECSLSEVYYPFEDGFPVNETEFSSKNHDTVAGLNQEGHPSVTEDENQIIYDSLNNSEHGKVELAQETEIPSFSIGLGQKKRVKKLNGQPSKNLMAERRRRKRLNDRLTMLRSVVPNTSKMDRTSILGDTIYYMKELLGRIKRMQEEIQVGEDQMNLLSISKDQKPNEVLVKDTPKFDVERSNTDTRIEICCTAKPGLLLSTVTSLEALGLEMQQCVISCFNDFGMQASCSEEMEQRAIVSSEDIKQALFKNAGYGGTCLEFWAFELGSVDSWDFSTKEMAEGVVTLFLNKLSELIERETHLLGGVSQDVRLLREKFQWISLFLKEADDKCLQDKKVKLWVAQVRDTAFEAEDIVEKFVLKVELSRRRAGFRRLLRNPINRWTALHKTGKEIQNINLKIDNISENRSKLDLGNIHEQYGGEPSTSGRKEKRDPTVEEAHIVGIEDEAEMVCKLLIEGDARRSVVSIIGIGGLGKTTLASKVFNDLRIRRHFECYAWIYASQEFKSRDLLYDLIKCLKTPSSTDVDKLKSLSGEELREELSNYLERRRYLIVIDDIWNREDWDYVQASLPNKNNGSRILLTTRHSDVALSSDPRCKPYWLHFLSHKDSRMLLLKKAFPEVVNHSHLEALEQVEEDMVIRCHGLPIAVVALGGLLSTKDGTIGEWEKVLKAIDLHQKEGQPTIFAILAVGYNDLPYYLKMCFLYFAAFPKDLNICASNLFQMWVAEGFVQERGDETPEEIAEDYLLELIHRNLVQVTERHFDGRVKGCRIHDIVRDFAIEIAKEDQFLNVYSADVHSASPTPGHRLSITHANGCKYVSMNQWTTHVTHLRSLFCFIQYDPTVEKENWNSLFKRFKFLRVMHIDSVPNSMVPDGIGDLIYLRYFSVRFKGKKHMLTLPSTISNLCNLQTLIILGAHKHLSDDQGTWKIRQLRHLVTSYGLFSSTANHMNLNELTNLHTLSMMTVGHWIMGEFDRMTSLRSLGLGGELNLYGTGLSSFIGKQANLKSLQLIQIRDDQLPIQIISSHLHHLEKLHLSGRLDKLPTLQEVAPCLTKLVLFNSRLVEDPMVVLEKLPKLELLRLKYGSYSGKKMSCSAKGFFKLAVLEINFLEELEDWTVEEGAIANLRHLEIRKCSKLKTIPEQFRHVATLLELPLLHAVDS